MAIGDAGKAEVANTLRKKTRNANRFCATRTKQIEIKSLSQMHLNA